MFREAKKQTERACPLVLGSKTRKLTWAETQRTQAPAQGLRYDKSMQRLAERKKHEPCLLQKELEQRFVLTVPGAEGSIACAFQARSCRIKQSEKFHHNIRMLRQGKRLQC